MDDLWDQTLRTQKEEDWSGQFRRIPQNHRTGSLFKPQKFSQATLEQCICKMIILTEQLLDSRLRNVESLVEENKQNLRLVRRSLVHTQKRVFGGQESEKENIGNPLIHLNLTQDKHSRASVGILGTDGAKPNSKQNKVSQIATPAAVNQAYKPIQVQVPVKNSDRSVVQIPTMKRANSKTGLSRGSSKSHLDEAAAEISGYQRSGPQMNYLEVSVPQSKELSHTSQAQKESAFSIGNSGSSKPGIQTTSSQRLERIGGAPSPQTANLLQDCNPLSETIQSSSQDTPPVRLPMHESLESFRQKQHQRKRQLELLEALQDDNVLHKIDAYSHLSWVLESDAQIKRGPQHLGDSDPKEPTSGSVGAQSNQTFGANHVREEIKLEECPERTPIETQTSPEGAESTEQEPQFDIAVLGFMIPEVEGLGQSVVSRPEQLKAEGRSAGSRVGIQSRDKTRNKKDPRSSKTREKVIGGPKPKPSFVSTQVVEHQQKKSGPVSSLTSAASEGSKKYYDQLLRELEAKERSKSRPKPAEAAPKPKSALKAKTVTLPEAVGQPKEIPEWSIKEKSLKSESTIGVSAEVNPRPTITQEAERSSSEEYDLVGGNQSRQSRSPAPRSAKRTLLTVAQHAPSAHQFEELNSGGGGWKKKLAFEDNTVTSKKGSATRTEKEVDQLVEDYLKNTALQNFPNTALKGLMGEGTSAKPTSQAERSDLNTSMSSSSKLARAEVPFNTDLESARYAHKILNKFSHKDLSLKGLFDGLSAPLSSDN